ncbi:S25 ribosomal protein-domain-containing protein [Aspergillus multicolor]|uniref:S25 ribosomal protein-domain-containing protein n=1 Tax=Aspergillus multicolor TaxID=41759 RepID=UPI003CCDF217
MSRICPTPTSSIDIAGSTSSSIVLSDDGEYAAQLNAKDLIIHLNPTSSDFKEVQIVKVKETGCKFLRFSRRQGTVRSRRLFCAHDSRIVIWDLDPLQQYAEIENMEPSALNIEYGADENEIIAFHAFNTKLTIFGLDSGRSHIIKSPKFSHQNGFGYRPMTGQLAILLKPETSDLLTVHEAQSYEVIGREILPTVDAQGLKWSPDGRWIAIWEAASAGTKVLIFTADGQFFRSYTGLPESDGLFDLGVRSIEWSPVAAQNGLSPLMAVGKVDGTVDLLGTKTFSCSSTLSHVLQIDQYSPSIWRERYASGGMALEYAEPSNSSAFLNLPEPTGTPRGVLAALNNHTDDKMAPAGKQKKKWSKGKVKDKAQHAVVLEKSTAERLNKDVQSYRLITVATLVDRLKINGSLARKALADLEEKGQIKKVVGHSKMNIYTRAVTAE